MVDHRSAAEDPVGVDGQRDVDPEGPAPREVVDEEAAQRRSRDIGGSPDAGDWALIASALARCDEVGQHRLREHDQAARKEPLDGARRRELEQVRGQLVGRPIEAAPKPTIEISISGRRPYKSLKSPKISVPIVEVSKYAATVHDRNVIPSSSRAMVGSAGPTIDWSTAPSPMARSTPISTRPKAGSRSILARGDEHQRGVDAAEPGGTADEHVRRVGEPRSVTATRRPDRIVAVDDARDDAVDRAQQRERRLPRAGRAQRVAVLAFRRGERQLAARSPNTMCSAAASPLSPSGGRRAVRVDRVDVVGRELRVGQRALHRERVERAFRLRRRHVIGVVGQAVAGDLAVDARAARAARRRSARAPASPRPRPSRSRRGRGRTGGTRRPDRRCASTSRE